MKISWLLNKTAIIFLSIFFLLIAVFLYFYLAEEYSRKFLTVIFLDVGQGDSIFIEAPNGNTILIDSGPTSSVVRELSKVLPFYKRKIDMTISTHSDLDHVGGFSEIFKRYEIGKYTTSNKDDTSELFQKLEILNESERADRFYLEMGDKIILDEAHSIYLEVLWPEDANNIEDNNDTSVMTRLVYGEVSFLLTGDASTEVESEIIPFFSTENLDDANLPKLKSNVLKIGHHGSKTSTSKEFLKLISPEYAIISAGKDNKFKHPHEEIMQMLNEAKIKTLETSVLGSIEFKTDGKNLWRVSR